MNLTDTILAISSPPTGGGVRGILRLSGPHAWQLAHSVLRTNADKFESVGVGHHGPFPIPLLHPHAKLATLLLFRAPRSFTGQDIAELHLPDSPALLKALLDQLLENARTLSIAARLADPGEFSARAFFHGKIDLTQAEGIAATINAANESQLRAAASLRTGDLHKWIAETAEKIANILALVEAGIDFVDEEDVHFIDPHEIEGRLEAHAHGIGDWLATSVRIDRINTLPTVAFTGNPNVGKSSLINALAEHDRSIVSPVAGTTRDMLTVILHTPRGDIRLLDVPGKEDPIDELRRKMMAARENALLDADFIIEVVADEKKAISTLVQPDQYAASAVVVQNKADLLPPAQLTPFYTDPDTTEVMPMREDWQLVSAKTGYKIPELRAAIARMVMRWESLGSHNCVLNHRHRDLLQQTKSALFAGANIAGSDSADKHPELLAAELRRALDLLGLITGAISPDEVLGRIFSQFCIGK